MAEGGILKDGHGGQCGFQKALCGMGLCSEPFTVVPSLGGAGSSCHTLPNGTV